MTRKFSALPAIVGVVLAATTFAILTFNNLRFMHDDAFITFRYAQNLVDHGQIVWNLGERVEGYTNFLYLLFVAAFMVFDVDPIVAARIISFSALIGIAVIFLGPVRKLTSTMPALGGAIVSLPMLPMVVWTLGMLEAPVVACFVLGTAAFVILAMSSQGDDAWSLPVTAGVFAALAILTRPDAALIAVASAPALLFGSANFRAGFKKACLFSVSTSVPVLLHLAWRFSYYGALVPNTVLAKVTGIEGTAGNSTDYILSFVMAAPFPIILVPVSLAIIFFRPRHFAAALYLAFVFILYAFYIIRVNGDHMPLNRLLVPVIPLIGLLVALAVDTLPTPSLRLWSPLVLSLLMASELVTTRGSVRLPMDTAAFGGLMQGRYIKANWKEGSTVALSTAGSIPYLNPDKRFIDMLGLNDKTIAAREITAFRAKAQHYPGHAKGDGAYVLARRPDYIIMTPSIGDETEEFWFLSDVELDETPLFHQCYDHRVVALTIPDDLKSQGALPGITTPAFPFHYYELRDLPECQP